MPERRKNAKSPARVSIPEAGGVVYPMHWLDLYSSKATTTFSSSSSSTFAEWMRRILEYPEKKQPTSNHVCLLLMLLTVAEVGLGWGGGGVVDGDGTEMGMYSQRERVCMAAAKTAATPELLTSSHSIANCCTACSTQQSSLRLLSQSHQYSFTSQPIAGLNGCGPLFRGEAWWAVSRAEHSVGREGRREGGRAVDID